MFEMQYAENGSELTAKQSTVPRGSNNVARPLLRDLNNATSTMSAAPQLPRKKESQKLLGPV